MAKIPTKLSLSFYSTTALNTWLLRFDTVGVWCIFTNAKPSRIPLKTNTPWAKPKRLISEAIQYHHFKYKKRLIFRSHFKIVFSQILQRFKSILLLFIMGMTILPWQLMCIAHPFGHDHHEHDGPSTCDLHLMAAQLPGEHLLPPMDCAHFSDATDDYNQTQVERIVPTIQLAAVIAVLFDSFGFEITQQHFLLPPDPNCRSATLLSDSPLRAPPLV